MKTPERFERALSKLIKAFFNDGLRKADCSACAVGNMCDGKKEWYNVFITIINWDNSLAVQHIFPSNYRGESKNVIDSTGYTWQQLAKVEKAFEYNTKIHWEEYHAYTKHEIMEDQFNGLMAVVDVLCEIEGIDSAPYKMKFEFNNELQPINK